MEAPNLESARLAEVARLMPEQRRADDLDVYAAIAALVTGAQAGLVSLISEHIQYIVSRWGIDIAETSRAISFCTTTIRSDEPMIVEDSHQDPRFRDNPLVTGEPFVRFYAGFPMVSRGSRVGTLCVIDSRPRHLNDKQRAELSRLARDVCEALAGAPESPLLDGVRRTLDLEH